MKTVKRKHSKKQPITDRVSVDKQVFFTFNKIRYAVEKVFDSELFRESDNLDSVRFDADKNIYVIATQRDFGGLGLDAVKKWIVPFEWWISKYCKVIEKE
jgi:hypothetical protein